MKLDHNIHHPWRTKICSRHKKTGSEGSVEGFEPPKIDTVFAFLSDTYSHSFNETFPQPSSLCMYQILFMALKQLRPKGVYGGFPQNRYLLSSLKLNTQFRWILTTTFNSHDVLKFVHGIKKLRGLPLKIGIYFSLYYIFCGSSMPTNGSFVILSSRYQVSALGCCSYVLK